MTISFSDLGREQNSEISLNPVEVCTNQKFIDHLNSYGTEFSPLLNDPEFSHCSNDFLHLCYREFMRNKIKYTKKLCTEQNKIYEILKIFKEGEKYKAEVVFQGNRRILGIEELKVQHSNLPFLLKDLEFREKQQLSYIKDLYGEMLNKGAIELEFLEKDMKEDPKILKIVEMKENKKRAIVDHDKIFDKIVAERENAASKIPNSTRRNEFNGDNKFTIDHSKNLANEASCSVKQNEPTIDNINNTINNKSNSMIDSKDKNMTDNKEDDKSINKDRNMIDNKSNSINENKNDSKSINKDNRIIENKDDSKSINKDNSIHDKNDISKNINCDDNNMIDNKDKNLINNTMNLKNDNTNIMIDNKDKNINNNAVNDNSVNDKNINNIAMNHKNDNMLNDNRNIMNDNNNTMNLKNDNTVHDNKDKNTNDNTVNDNNAKYKNMIEKSVKDIPVLNTSSPNNINNKESPSIPENTKRNSFGTSSVVIKIGKPLNKQNFGIDKPTNKGFDETIQNENAKKTTEHPVISDKEQIGKLEGPKCDDSNVQIPFIENTHSGDNANSQVAQPNTNTFAKFLDDLKKIDDGGKIENSQESKTICVSDDDSESVIVMNDTDKPSTQNSSAMDKSSTPNVSAPLQASVLSKFTDYAEFSEDLLNAKLNKNSNSISTQEPELNKKFKKSEETIQMDLNSLKRRNFSKLIFPDTQAMNRDGKNKDSCNSKLKINNEVSHINCDYNNQAGSSVFSTSVDHNNKAIDNQANSNILRSDTNLPNFNCSQNNQVSGNQASSNKLNANSNISNVKCDQAGGNQASDIQVSSNQASGIQASSNQASGNQASGIQVSSNQASGIQVSGNQAGVNKLNTNNNVSNPNCDQDNKINNSSKLSVGENTQFKLNESMGSDSVLMNELKINDSSNKNANGAQPIKNEVLKNLDISFYLRKSRF